MKKANTALSCANRSMACKTWEVILLWASPSRSTRTGAGADSPAEMQREHPEESQENKQRSKTSLNKSDVHNVNKSMGWEGNATAICKYIKS